MSTKKTKTKTKTVAKTKTTTKITKKNKKIKTGKEILIEYLTKKKFDGLFNKKEGCACSVENLMPDGCCGFENCTTGHFVSQVGCDTESGICIGVIEKNKP